MYAEESHECLFSLSLLLFYTDLEMMEIREFGAYGERLKGLICSLSLFLFSQCICQETERINLLSLYSLLLSLSHFS